MYAHQFQQTGGDYGRKRGFSKFGTFQVEFFVQHVEETRDGEVASNFRGHDGGGNDPRGFEGKRGERGGAIHISGESRSTLQLKIASSVTATRSL